VGSDQIGSVVWLERAAWRADLRQRQTFWTSTAHVAL